MAARYTHLSALKNRCNFEVCCKFSIGNVALSCLRGFASCAFDASTCNSNDEGSVSSNPSLTIGSVGIPTELRNFPMVSIPATIAAADFESVDLPSLFSSLSSEIDASNASNLVSIRAEPALASSANFLIAASDESEPNASSSFFRFSSSSFFLHQSQPCAFHHPRLFDHPTVVLIFVSWSHFLGHWHFLLVIWIWILKLLALVLM